MNTVELPQHRGRRVSKTIKYVEMVLLVYRAVEYLIHDSIGALVISSIPGALWLWKSFVDSGIWSCSIFTKQE